jgi:DNA-binding MarR family transcriptional regulator
MDTTKKNRNKTEACDFPIGSPTETGQVVDLISRIHRRTRDLLLVELSRSGAEGLVPSHGDILIRLYQEGPLSMSRLSERVDRRKNTLTVLVRKLQESGYVTCTPDSSDGRVLRVSLTPKGEAFEADFRGISARLLKRLWGHMPGSEQERLTKGLRQLQENLDSPAQEEGKG